MTWVKERQGPVITAGILLAVVVILLATGEKEALVIGLITGSAYGLLALGLVMIYKSSGVFNFAQGEFGSVAVCVLYLLHTSGVPYGLAVIAALLAGMLFGFLTERIVIRPLFDAPRVIVLVATALGQPWRPQRPGLPGATAAGVLGAAATVCFLLATREGYLSIASVVTSLYPAFTVILAATLLREHVHRAQAAGLLLCAVAVTLVAAG